jgi:hypothetical protein
LPYLRREEDGTPFGRPPTAESDAADSEGTPQKATLSASAMEPLERMMKRTVTSWLRALTLLPAAFAANSAFAAVPMPDLANIDWQRTGLLAGAFVVLAIAIAVAMSGKRSVGPQDEGYLRRIGNMPAEPTETREAPRGGSDEELDPRRRVEGKLPGFPV